MYGCKHVHTCVHAHTPAHLPLRISARVRSPHIAPPQSVSASQALQIPYLIINIDTDISSLMLLLLRNTFTPVLILHDNQGKMFYSLHFKDTEPEGIGPGTQQVQGSLGLT